MTQTEKLLSMTSQQLNMLSDVELNALLRQTRKTISARLKAIEKAGFTPLVENLKELQAPINIKSRHDMEGRLGRYKTFLRSETSSVTRIRNALKSGYDIAKEKMGDFGQLAETTTIFSPSQVVHKTVTSETGRKYERFYTKDGRRVVMRYTIAGEVVYVPTRSTDPALMTQTEFTKQMSEFNKARQTQEIQNANIPSDHLGILLWHARKGRIRIGKTKIGKGKTSPSISTAKNIAEAVVEVYEKWQEWAYLSQQEREDALKLADASVYQDLDMAK